MNNTLSIANVTVRRDEEGRYCLNDLHKAAGGESRHAPNYFMALESTKSLIHVLSNSRDNGINPVDTKRGRYGGSFVAKQVVYAYAMWISPEFNLKVIDAYDAMQAPANAKPLTHTQMLAAQAQAMADIERLQACTGVVISMIIIT